MSMHFNKIFISSIISILVILQIKHGLRLNTYPVGDYQNNDNNINAVVPVESDGYRKLEAKYQQVLNEIDTLRKEIDILKAARNAENKSMNHDNNNKDLISTAQNAQHKSISHDNNNKQLISTTTTTTASKKTKRETNNILNILKSAENKNTNHDDKQLSSTIITTANKIIKSERNKDVSTNTTASKKTKKEHDDKQLSSTVTTAAAKKNKGERNKDVEFSACLLIKDENHNLPEWIAYHYYMVKLRHLVVCVDPFSESAPQEILQQWTNTSLSIEIWPERSFFPPSPLKRLLNTSNTEKIISLHRQRQRSCYSKCMKHLKNNGKSTWTMFIDADEYLTFNSVADDDSKLLYMKANRHDPNSSYKFIPPKGRLTHSKILMERRTKLPTGLYHHPRHGNNKTISDVIKQQKHEIPWNETCIVLPRLQFADEEETNPKILKHSISTTTELETKKFTTLRFFTHGRKGSLTQNKFGKCIVDVSRIKKFGVLNPHYFSSECGPKGSSNPDHVTALLRVNHYLPPKEVFFSKVDFRRNEEMFKKKAEVNHAKSYEMQGWLDKFINDIGSLSKAKELLKCAGEYMDVKGTRDFTL